MSKTLKMSILLLIITLGFLFLSHPEVYAVEINSVEELEQAFQGKNVSVYGTSIVLNDDAELSDVIELGTLDYTLQLNDHTLTVQEFKLNSGTLTIYDMSGRGKIASEGPIWIGKPEDEESQAKMTINGGNYGWVENYGELTIGSGEFETINNGGTLTVNWGTVHSIWNTKDLTINDGYITDVSHESGKLVINGGEFTAYNRIDVDSETGEESEWPYCSYWNIDSDITISGGTFKATNLDYVLRLTANTEGKVKEDSIDSLVKEGYKAMYNVKSAEDWDVYYSRVEIVPEEAYDIFEHIAPNGIWEVNSYIPEDSFEAQHTLTALALDAVEGIDTDKILDIYAGANQDPEEAHIQLSLEGLETQPKINVKVVYNEPESTSYAKVNEVLNKMRDIDIFDLDEEISYRLEDLNLINYLVACKDDEHDLSHSKALNFSKELIEIVDGANISFRIISGLGGGSPYELYSYDGGLVVVYFNGMPYATKGAGLNMNHVLYIPDDTENTADAYIKAAMKRIEDYLGTTEGIKLEVGGKFEEFEEDWNEHGFIDEKTCGANYYNLTIGDKTLRFAICKKSESELETPKYLGSDVVSDITITTDESEVPLDTALTVEKEENDKIKEALGTDKYVAYNISLYSNAKAANIKKLENGKFNVSIPVPKIFEGKEITVYYINSENEKEEHTATVKEGYVEFETNHFSTYALTETVVDKEETQPIVPEEKPEEKPIVPEETEKNETTPVTPNEPKEDNLSNPKTGDNIVVYAIILVVSVAGILVVKRKKK